MAHRKIGSLRSKFGISRSMNDLAHLFSDKSKSDSELNDVTISETPRTRNEKKRSLRRLRHSGKFGKQQVKDEHVISCKETSEQDNVELPAVTEWNASDTSVNDKSQEHHKKGKPKTKEEKKHEKQRDKNEDNSLPKSETTRPQKQLPDQVDATAAGKTVAASWTSNSLVIQELLHDFEYEPE